MILSVLLLVAVITLALICVERNRQLPPGPWGLPFFGYYPFLTPKLYLQFSDLSKKYGDVFSFRTIGGKLIVVLNGTKTIKDILVNRSQEFIGRPLETNLFTWISGGTGVIQEEGSIWKEHRRFFLQAAKNYGFGNVSMETIIHDEITDLLKDMRETKGKSTDFDVHVSYVTNSVISQILFAKKLNKKHFPKLIRAMHHLVQTFGDHRFMLVGTFFEYVAMKFFPWSAKVRQARVLVKKTFNAIIDEHLMHYSPGTEKDYVDSYLRHAEHLEERGDENSFTIERLRAISINMAVEGTETVSDAILDLLIKASQHPEEQKLAQAELDEVIGMDRLPSCLDRPQLPYLEAFIEELHRTAMSFYITTQYCNFEDTSIENYHIPKRTILVANLWTINNDPNIFPEPEKFDVERFLSKNGKMVAARPYPFGLGKRKCIGQSLGQMEVFLIIASILQSFTLLPGDGKHTLRTISRH